MVGAWTYAFAANFVPSYRDTADKIRNCDIGILQAHDEEKCVYGDEWEEKILGGAVVEKHEKV